MYSQHRPPTAPPTPDSEMSGPGLNPSQTWGAGPQSHHYPQNGPNLAPGPYLFDRQSQSRHTANSTPGFSSAYGASPPDIRLATPGTTSIGAGSENRHQPSTSPAVTGAHTTGSTAPLLLNNLAQHLNNPPAPAGNMAGLVGAGVFPGQGGPPAGTGKLLLPGGALPPAGSEEEKIYELITELLHPATREGALLELSKKREMYEDLALVLWGGFGIMSSLLLEIVNVYPALSPPALTAHASNRVCNALALLQCVASHSDTRSLFLNAHVPLFLYPFLNTTSKTRPFEYLRLTSLGVIGALVKQTDNTDVINFLLSTEIIPLCLRIMETGSELSKTVAIFIVQKILLDDLGLQYICQTYERFYAVGAVLANMVQALVDTQAVRLLKHVVRCYLRMSDNPRAREALRACLPEALRDGTFNALLKGDMVTKRCLSTLIMNLSERNE